MRISTGVSDAYAATLKIKGAFRGQRNNVFKGARVARAARRAAGRLLRVTLMVSLLTGSTGAAPLVLASTFQEWRLGFSLWLLSDGAFARMVTSVGGSSRPVAAPPETQAERNARLRKVEISPARATLRAGEQAAFVAIGYGDHDVPVGGVRFTWAISGDGANRDARVSSDGVFEADGAGEYVVTAEGAGRVGRAVVSVIGERPGRGGAPTTPARPAGKRRVSTNDVPDSLGPSGAAGLRRAKHPAAPLGARYVSASFVRAAAEPAPAPVPQAGGDPYGWNERNKFSADDAVNERGTPPGRVSLGGANSHNYKLVAPIVSLPGRGLDFNLALTYNSRVWNKSKSATVSEIAFDIDKETPAPGWNLGYGKMVNMVDGGAMLIEPDGTRHGFEGDVYDVGPYGAGAGPSKTFVGGTNDGTFIEYSCETNSRGGGGDWGIVKYPSGVVVWYNGKPEPSGERILYPTRITDANGNFISIVRDFTKPARPITSIVDTLGRVLTFHYDANNLLTCIKAVGLPDESGTRVERTLVRLHYRTLQLDYSFSADLTPLVRSGSVSVIDAIYYPDSHAGYWFGDGDSYSSYGMIAKVAEQHSMGFTPGATDDEQGTVIPGSLTRQTVYNYPLTKAAGGTLSDAPAYDTATETWDGMDTGPAVTSYDLSHQEDSPRKVTVTRPDGTRVVEYSYNEPNQFMRTDGLAYKREVLDEAGAVLYSQTTEFETGLASSPPRPHAVEMTDEQGQKSRTEYDYSTDFNNVTETREYDFGGGLIRRAVRTYVIDTGYTTPGFSWDHFQNDHFKPRLTNLVTSESVYAGATADTLVSKTEYKYDEDPNPLNIPPGPPCYGCTYTYQGRLANTPGVVQHSDAFDPYRGPQSLWVGTGWNPNRGNLTTTISYPDAKQASGAITRTLKFDITGNTVSAKGGGSEVAFTFSPDLQYAYVTARTHGSAAAASRVVTTCGYDFYTGLQTSATDANGRTTTAEYAPLTWRPVRTTAATGAHTDFSFDDGGLSTTETTYDAQGYVAVQSVTRLNGQGQARRVEALAGAGVWDVVETKYDKLSRVWKTTSPFRDGTPAAQWKWAENVYDALGRVMQRIGPDGSVTLAEYNAAARPQGASGAPGKTFKVTDAWGRERWGRANSEGKLVELVEPNPDGGGTVAAGGLVSTYKYDALGNLTEVQQGAQRRLFAYDSMSRLIRQKMAEASATLDDAGNLSANGTWSEVLTYDDRSNVVARVDARGVRTTYSYSTADGPDPLNRLLSVEYDAGGAAGVLPSPKVSFSYKTDGDVTRVKSITTEGVSTEEFLYDAEARLQERKLTLAARPGFPLATSYVYDSLNRVTDIVYPKQYGSGLEPRKTVHQDFGVAGRLSGLKVDGAEYASQIAYNAFGQAESLLVGGAGPGRTTEDYEYDGATGTLNRQKVSRGTSTLLDLSYEYLRPGTASGRTGQLTSITNNLNPQKGRTYSYDALGRLTRATGGDPSSTPLWTQQYSYDRYGNRTGVAASGNAAGLNMPPEPTAETRRVEVASYAAPRLPGVDAVESGRAVSDAPAGVRLFSPVPAAAAAPLADAPTNLVVTSATADGISLGWAGPAGTYRVERKMRQANGGQYAFLTLVTGNAFTDAPPAAAQVTAYQYRVCAAASDGSCASGYSNAALGTAVTFTDPQLTAGVTKVKAQHFVELRQSVDAVRFEAYLPTGGWSEALTPSATPVRAAHVEELRNRLDEALTRLHMPAPPFTDPTLLAGAGGTPIRKVHVEELRQRSTRGAGTAPDGCLPDEQFVSEFYQHALARNPSAGEMSYWVGRLRQAAGQGSAARLGVARELGRALFLSAEYTARNRSISEYVSDLYWGYLGRASDAGGQAFWEGQIAAQEPEQRRMKGVSAFEESTEFGNRVAGTCGPAAGSSAVPADGIDGLTYDAATNRVNSPGWEYDAAGNQTRAPGPHGGWLRYQYDAAGRLAKVKDDSEQTLVTYTYEFSSRRLVAQHGNEASSSRTYYAWGADGVIAEYYEDATRPFSPAWGKAYIYLSSTLLAAHTAGPQGELVEFYHPDRIGVRLVTNPSAGGDAERVTLPYGTTLGAESAGVVNGATQRAFTSYDRSQDTELDYAQNRFYDWNQSRFTQVDPTGFGASSLGDPQSFNLYAYCANDPVNRTDPSGLDGFGISITFPFPGGGGGGARTGWLWLGGLAGLFNFGIGALGWLIQRPPTRQPFITNAFTTFLTAPRAGVPDPQTPPSRHVSVAVYGTYDTTTSTHWREGDNIVFQARARQFAGENIMPFSAGAAIIASGRILSAKVGAIDSFAIFGHGHPPGIIGGYNKFEGLYISNSGNYLAYSKVYPVEGGTVRYNYGTYFKEDGTPRGAAAGAASVQDLARAILRGEINIAQGGEIVFYGCYTEAMASELQWNLKDGGRPDIRVTGFGAQADMSNPRYVKGTWRSFTGPDNHDERGRGRRYK